MDDRQEIEQLYHDMYAAMVAKDEVALDRVHDDSFVLVHMTGMRQDKRTYIRAIMDGTLNYFSEKTDSLDIQVHGDEADMVGHSRVAAAVFGGGRYTWPLALHFKLRRTPDGWKLTHAEASTY